MPDPSSRPFEATLLAHAPQDLLAAPRSAELEPLLEALLTRCQRAWPQLRLSSAGFLRYLAERLQGPSLAEALATVHAEDLYLACACAASDPEALAAFDRGLLSQVRAFLAGQRPTPTLVDEVQQQLRERLLVARAGEVPRIAEYSGRGALLGWVRIAAVRTALNLRRNKDDQLEGQEQADPERILTPGADPELEYLRRRYQGEFKAAVQEALAALDPDQRTFLRMHLNNGLSGEQIGALFHISRATAQRRVAEAREAVGRGTRKLLQERLQISPLEFQSMARLVLSELNVSIARCLTDEPEQA